MEKILQQSNKSGGACSVRVKSRVVNSDFNAECLRMADERSQKFHHFVDRRAARFGRIHQ